MAGFVRVYDGGQSGVLSVGSRSVMQLYEYLISCKSASRVLAADPEFDPQSDYWAFGAGGNYLHLADLSNETLAEIARLLIDASVPEHPYWSDDSKRFDQIVLDLKRSQGCDVESECLQFKRNYQTAFRQVAELIQHRLAHPKM